MPSVPTPPRDTGWTLSASISVYPSYAACRLLYYVWQPRAQKRGKELKLRHVSARPGDVTGAVDSLIELLQAYRRTLED